MSDKYLILIDCGPYRPDSAANFTFTMSLDRNKYCSTYRCPFSLFQCTIGEYTSHFFKFAFSEIRPSLILNIRDLNICSKTIFFLF